MSTNGHEWECKHEGCAVRRWAGGSTPPRSQGCMVEQERGHMWSCVLPKLKLKPPEKEAKWQLWVCDHEGCAQIRDTTDGLPLPGGCVAKDSKGYHRWVDRENPSTNFVRWECLNKGCPASKRQRAERDGAPPLGYCSSPEGTHAWQRQVTPVHWRCARCPDTLSNQGEHHFVEHDIVFIQGRDYVGEPPKLQTWCCYSCNKTHTSRMLPPSGVGCRGNEDEPHCWRASDGQLVDYRPTEDPVSPSHYQDGGEEFTPGEHARMTRDEFRGAMLFSARKYLRRAGKKDSLIVDLQKSMRYIRYLIEAEEAHEKENEDD